MRERDRRTGREVNNLVLLYINRSSAILDHASNFLDGLCRDPEEEMALRRVFAYDYARKMGGKIYTPHNLQGLAEDRLEWEIQTYSHYRAHLNPFIKMARGVSNSYLAALTSDEVENVEYVRAKRTLFGHGDVPILKSGAVERILEDKKEQILKAREEVDDLKRKVNIIE